MKDSSTRMIVRSGLVDSTALSDRGGGLEFFTNRAGERSSRICEARIATRIENLAVQCQKAEQERHLELNRKAE